MKKQIILTLALLPILCLEALSGGLELLTPTANDVLISGDETLITWTGVSPDEKIIIDFSTDGGVSWANITREAGRLSYLWQNIPLAVSENCLLRIETVKKYPMVPIVEWEKTIGGSGEDNLFSMDRNGKGEFIAAGHLKSKDAGLNNNGGLDYWVLCLNDAGETLWQKNYGGSRDEILTQIVTTSDGGYLLGGSSNSSDGDIHDSKGREDFWLVKLDDKGGLQWSRSYGGIGIEVCNSIAEAAGGGFIAAGFSDKKDGDVGGLKGAEDYWIVKIDEFGNIEWERNYGGSGSDYAYSVKPANDGGFVLAGSSLSNDGDINTSKGTTNFWVVKLDENGVIQWERAYGGSKVEWANDVIQTRDGGYILAGQSNSSDGDVSEHKGDIDYYHDFWIVRIDFAGNIIWERSFGGIKHDVPHSVKETNDGGFIIAGSSNSETGDISGHFGGTDIWMLKLKANGDIDWNKNIGGTGNDAAHSVYQTDDDGYIVAGWTESADRDVSNPLGERDGWIVKLSADQAPLADTSDSEITLLMPWIILELPEVKAEPGSRVCVPLYAYFSKDMAYELRYDILVKIPNDVLVSDIVPEYYDDNWQYIRISGKKELNHGKQVLSDICGKVYFGKDNENALIIAEYDWDNEEATSTTINGKLIINLDSLCAPDLRKVKFRKPLEISVNPNPASDMINLKISGNNSDAALFIYDYSGTAVYKKKVKINGTKILEIPSNKLSNGIYRAVIISGDEIETNSFHVFK
ncbi:MAG: T9SS type A sorting domain-containing protein [Candidatus Kapaibacterium sp.]